MKNEKKKICLSAVFLLLLLFIFPFSLFSVESSWSSTEISRSLYRHFNRKNIVKQNLCSTQETAFPYNLIITVNSSREDVQDSFIFSFTQEFAVNNLDYIDSFIQWLENANLSYNSVILLTANDNSPVPPEIWLSELTGTCIYTSQIESRENTHAIVFIETQKKESYRIISGGNLDVSPRWMAKDLTQLCKDNSYPYKVSNNSILLYKTGIVQENPRVTPFFKADIPCIGIEFNTTDFPQQLLEKTAETFSKDLSPDWDRHYSIINIGKISLWPSEEFYVYFYFIFSMLTLVVIFFRIFSNNEKNAKMVKKIARTWYFIPLVIIISSLVIQLVQLLLRNFNISPEVFLGIKIISVFAVTEIIYLIQIYFNFKISYRASGYFLMLISALNLFIFATIDLSLIFVFFIEFLLALLCRQSGKHKVPLIIFTILMFVPFFPYLRGFYSADSTRTFQLIAYTSYGRNFLLAMVLFPFQLQWARVILAFDVLNKNNEHTSKQYIIRSIIIFFTSIAIYSAVYAAGSVFLISLTEKDKESSVTVITAREDFAEVKYKETSFEEFKLNHIILDSNENILRYVVTAESTDGAPIYGSNFDYTFSSPSMVYFELPDNPSQRLDISFRSYDTKDITIKVIAICTTKDFTLERQENIIHLEAKH